MEALVGRTLSEHFGSIEDPRVVRTKRHPLLSIVTIALCAVISGAESWNEIEEFGEAMEDWFADFLELPNGIPSRDTFSRVFSAFDPQKFRECFLGWMRSVAGVLPAQVVALDGKALRGSHDKWADKGPIYMVSAWAAQDRLILGQVKVDEKSNEITALPELLRCLAISGCIVTIDAMGCQREIAQQILDQGGDYVLALKGNQGTLHQDVEMSFAEAMASQFEAVVHDHAEPAGKGHGRIEIRRTWVIDDAEVMEWINFHHQWPGLAAIGMVQSERRIGTQRTEETRYYILSQKLSAARFGETVTSHWGIENQLHWVLDVAFREDDSRIRQGHAAENFAVLRHIALNPLRSHPTKKRLSIKGRRLKAGWDRAYLMRLLTEN